MIDTHRPAVKHVMAGMACLWVPASMLLIREFVPALVGGLFSPQSPRLPAPARQRMEARQSKPKLLNRLQVQSSCRVIKWARDGKPQDKFCMHARTHLCFVSIDDLAIDRSHVVKRERAGLARCHWYGTVQFEHWYVQLVVYQYTHYAGTIEAAV